MASNDLRTLWKLHLIDEAIYEIRARAAALDPGKKIMAEMQALQAQLDEVGGKAKALIQEQTDLEVAQKGIDAKIDKIDKDLYGGKVVNPREVENLQKEIASLKARRSEMDERLLELMELVPPAKSAADQIEAAISEKKKELAAHQKKVLEVKAQLEAGFKQKMAERPQAAAQVPTHLLNRYEPLLKKLGTAMARISKTSSCEACGMNLAEKVIEFVKDDKVMTCEACHRILYYSDGVI